MEDLPRARQNRGGKNALDFFIAFEMGRIMEKHPHAVCTILSGDKGFDPLRAHIRSKHYRRITDTTVLTRDPAAARDA